MPFGVSSDMDFAHRTFRRLKQEHDPAICHPDAGGYCPCPNDPTPVSEAEADVVCSDVQGTNGLIHCPVIDLDLPCQLVPSATPGHFHLYIDRPVPKEQYLAILEAMADAGIVQEGFLRASGTRGYGAVRHPDKPKKVSA